LTCERWFGSCVFTMTRPLRINIEDGWYHVCARGIDRRIIYGEDCERIYFLERLEKKSENSRKIKNLMKRVGDAMWNV